MPLRRTKYDDSGVPLYCPKRHSDLQSCHATKIEVVTTQDGLEIGFRCDRGHSFVRNDMDHDGKGRR